MELIPIKRKSFTIAFLGNKGVGKTLLMTLLGYMYYLKGYIIFSNYPVKFKHILIDSLKDFQNIYDLYDMNIKKLFIGDDFERWFNSRNYKSKINIEIDDILLDWGKLNCSLLYSSKRSMSIHIGLRETTDEFWFPDLRLRYKTNDPKKNKFLEKYLNFYNIVIKRYDSDLVELPSMTVEGLTKIVKLYDTQTIIKKIIDQ